MKQKGKKGVAEFIDLYENGGFNKDKQGFVDLLESQLKNAPETCFLPKEMDIAIAGCGFKNIYSLGVCLVLKHYGIKVGKVTGASSGSWFGLFLCADILKPEEIFKHKLYNFPFAWIDAHKKYSYVALEPVWRHVITDVVNNMELPEDDTLFISISKFHTFYFEEIIKSQFRDKEELVEILLASSAIPIILTEDNSFFKTYEDDWIVDGGLTNNCPISILYNDDDSEEQNAVLKIDSNLINVNWFRFFWNVIYVTRNDVQDLFLQGIRDTIELIQSQERKINGLQIIENRELAIRRLHSYQLLPTSPHSRDICFRFQTPDH